MHEANPEIPSKSTLTGIMWGYSGGFVTLFAKYMYVWGFASFVLVVGRNVEHYFRRLILSPNL